MFMLIITGEIKCYINVYMYYTVQIPMSVMVNGQLFITDKSVSGPEMVMVIFFALVGCIDN